MATIETWDDAAPSAARRAAGGFHAPTEQARLIERSRTRCVRSGLRDSMRPEFDSPRRGDWRALLEKTEALRRHAMPVMETLREQIANTHSMVVLTDCDGLILHSQGDQDFLERAQRVALSTGVCWGEGEKGTNAIGTAIVEQQPTLVHADQHFLAANHFLTCSAAPIFDAHGRLTGVLDVTGDQRSYHQHTMALVRMSATMIENKLVMDGAGVAFRVHFHRRPEFIGTLSEGIAAFSADGAFVACNRIAQSEFGLARSALAGQRFEALFDLPLATVIQRAQRDPMRPLALHAAGERPVFVRLEVLSINRAAALLPPACRGAAADRASRAHDDAAGAAAAPATGTAAARRGATRAAALERLDSGDATMSAVVAKVRKVIDRGIPVLIQGETGCGKELLARAIHEDSARGDGPFVSVDCASLPESLIESELFGYEEGAFTGARRRGQPGKVLQAHRGTLFLDEIGDMPLTLQARLLRVLQERVVTPLGGGRPVPVDIQVVSATHRNVRQLVMRRQFREDLYFRLNGLTVTLPPLRERGDLEVLVYRILDEVGGEAARTLSPQTMRLLRESRWPGNVRQLASLLRTACAIAGDESVIELEHLPEDFLDEGAHAGSPLAEALPEPVRAAWPADAADLRRAAPATGARPVETADASDLGQIALAAIERALLRNRGNVARAARELGISRNTVYRKLRAAGRMPAEDGTAD